MRPPPVAGGSEMDKGLHLLSALEAIKARQGGPSPGRTGHDPARSVSTPRVRLSSDAISVEAWFAILYTTCIGIAHRAPLPNSARQS